MASNNGDFRNCIDSVRLSREEQDALLTQLNSAPVSASARERRSQERLSYRRPAGLLVQMRHPGGTTENYLVSARNLSGGGIAFLHGSFVYNNTPCILALIATDNRIVRVEGRVVRCQHISRHIHDIGVKFDGAINLDQFIQLDAPAGATPTSRPLPHLGGRALCLVDRPHDQQVITFYLKQLGMDPRVFSDAMVALELTGRTRFDAVVTSMALPPLSAADIAGLLRQTGFTGPILALANDENESTRRQAVEQGCNHVLVKPFNLEELMDVLVQHLDRTRNTDQAA